MANKSSLYSDSQVSAVFVLMFAVLPVFFIPALFNAYRLPREALAALVAAALSIYWLLQLHQQANEPHRSFPLLLPLGLLLGSAALSLPNSINIYDGVMRSLTLGVGLVFFFATVNFASREKIPDFLRCIALAGVCISVIGIFQTWGVRFTWVYEFASPASLYGNKNLAAQFLIFSLPAAVYLLLAAPDTKREFGCTAMVAINASYLSYTWARSAWGAVIVSTFLVTALLLIKRLKAPKQIGSWKRKSIWLFGAMILVILMNVLPARWVSEWRAGWTVGSLSGSEHLMTAISLSTQSAQSRFVIWQNTLGMFADHYLVGMGPGNFQYTYPLYSQHSAKDLFFNIDIKATEAHNDYLQLLAERGLLGGSIFVWIMLALAWRLWRGFRQPFNPLLFPIALSLCAMLLLAFWDFPFAMPVPAALFWSYAGIGWKLAGDSTDKELRPKSRKLAWGVVAVLAFCSAVTAAQACRHAWADYYYARSLNEASVPAAGTSGLARQLAEIEQAIHNYPYDYRYHFQKGRLLTQFGRHADAASANLAALSWNPYDINTLNNLGVNYTHLGNLPAAIAAYEQAMHIWPFFLDANNSLALLYEVSGQREKAITTFRKSLEIQPEDRAASERLQSLLKSM